MRLAISGTPGTGKTEVARALAGRLGWRLVELNALAQEKGLYCGYDDKRKCKVVDIDGIAGELEKVKGENIILESHYAHEIPSDIVVILRTNPGELRKRLESKGWGREKIEENVQAEIMEVCREEAMERGGRVIEIETTGKKPEDVAGEILEAMGMK